MNKQEKLDIINRCIAEKTMFSCCFTYDKSSCYYYYPNAVSDRLVLAQQEDDFILNGYTVRKLYHLSKVEVVDNKCTDINKKYGLTEQVIAPDVDVTSWKTVFEDLEELECLIIIEDEINNEYYIGRIEKIFRNEILFRAFDADGIIDSEPTLIPYSAITSVSWNTRYANGWEKYLVDTALEASAKAVDR
ncbi:MAG: hypothetical protein IKB34_03565 [Clostridia bacterium]|nr:hypothetical protein [Clostridia bacterium]